MPWGYGGKRLRAQARAPPLVNAVAEASVDGCFVNIIATLHMALRSKIVHVC